MFVIYIRRRKTNYVLLKSIYLVFYFYLLYGELYLEFSLAF